ncbi:MAG: endonuclease V [ANME-2 cluster archaeon]|nr:endonuclease V [ANME-2 cluster archaeon]MBC2700318.1 endonuclease V [ANME-2 cluster archaeon]MBC2706148.1 endonuclease V [ANME-2 cluster archaeon]MBC2748420.1 endonuclease V [ANME-2 cluster archaeon]MBC2761861.1 endonuclease V [ANME-2 cluster archaeon]
MGTPLFPADLSTTSLLRAQEIVRQQAVLHNDHAPPRFVAGVDQAFMEDVIISGIVMIDYESLDVVEEVQYTGTIGYPYIPTFLSFREGPAIVSAYGKLQHTPDILMVDGCGINHPRGAGLATHIGVALDVPTIGVAKHILCGKGDAPLEVGDISPLIFESRQVGWLIKSCRRCRPIVVAPGHRVSMEGALKTTKHMLRGHKLPEPCLLAHKYVNNIKKI